MKLKAIDINNNEFQNALKIINYTHQSLFLTGKAGTGKSTFLRYVCENTKKKHIVLAPTGIAAINAGGNTMHSFFKLPFYPLLPDDPNFSFRKIKSFLKYGAEKRKIIRELELIIIDEISMVRADIIDFIDKILRIYGENTREPFGGKQIMFVGDVFQLEPVVKADEREILNRFYPSPYFFNANVFREMELVSIELKKVYRQTDKAFISVLDKIRNNTAGKYDIELLNTRVGANISSGEDDDMFITIATKRDNVDFINSAKLAELPDDIKVLTGEIKGEFPESSLPTQLELELKPGAQIIFIKNDRERRWVNGTIGKIESIADDCSTITITTEDKRKYIVEQEQWENVKYTYNEKEKKVEEEVIGVFIQFPVRLAWAITVHKSQGLTFNRALIDFSGGVFAGGQAYVALSRCTSLDGMSLKTSLTRGDIFIKTEIVEFSRHFNDNQALERAMKNSKADIAYGEAIRLFDEGDMAGCLDNFFTAIHARYDIEKPIVRRYIQRKLNTVNSLRKQNEAIKKEMHRQQLRLKKYANEYYQMGNDCITQAHDTKAAIANYNKALDLCPNHTDTLVRLGIVMNEEGNQHEAMKYLNMAVEISPSLFKAVYNRGKVRLAMNNAEEAASDFSRATTLKPDHAKAHELFGDALMRSGHEDDATIQWAIAEQLRKNKDKS